MTRTVQREMLRRKAVEDKTSFAEKWNEFHPKHGRKRKYIGVDRSVPFIDRLTAYRNYINMVRAIQEQAKQTTDDPEAASKEIEKQIANEKE